MLVKVVASFEDAKKASTMSFDWTTDEAGQLSTSSSQTIPALIKEEEIPGRTIKESPTLTAINEKKPEKPSINFVKKDVASGEKLFGAQFVLYKGNEELADTLTSSDKEGKFAFNELEDGSYTVYETSAPDGYPYLEDKENVASFTVSEGKITVLRTNPYFGNTKTTEFDSNKDYIIYNKVNEIKFRKVGEDNKKLSSGKFEIRKVSNELITEKITSEDGTTHIVVKSKPSELVASTKDTTPNENGELVWSIKEPGRYQVVETQAPKGYKEVGSEGLVVAEFTVAKETLEITNILAGDKFYSDTKEFPEGGFVNIENKKQGQGSFEITKTDMGQSPKVLKGAKFLLEDRQTGTFIKSDGTITNDRKDALSESDKSGKISYNNLSNGTYILREYEAPDGYIKSKNVWEVTVQDSTTTISLATKVDESESVIDGSNLTVKNRGNKITFEKVDKDNTDKKLQGAEFIVYREQDYTNWEGNTGYERYKDANDTFTTDNKGKIVLENLKMGHYKVYERKVPTGYYVEDDLAENSNVDMPGLEDDDRLVAEFYVDINGYIKADEKDEGTTTELTKVIKNTANKAKFRLLKVDNNNKALRSAQFTLTEDGSRGNKGYKYVGTTTSDGAIEFANLKAGETYTLKETKAPDGYIATDQEWKVVVDQAGKVSIQAKNGSTDGSIVAVTDDINNLSDKNKEKLNANGYLILNATDDKDTTIKVVNKKPTYPSTGGAGTFIGFTLIGTAIMLAGIAYFAILQNDKKRRRSDRYGR